MNFVFVSPNFPVRYFKWVEALKDHGVNALGIGDTPYSEIDQRLKNSLTEYYFLSDLNSIEDKSKAISYFESKYGHIDYLESNNEWWLESDAILRERFSINTGFYPSDMEKIKAKSAMKEAFQRAGIKTMRYVLIRGKQDSQTAYDFVEKVGYPVFVKPNIGVGAADSYCLKNPAELQLFLERELPETYIMEEYIDGYIVSFDGICNSKSEVVFATSDHFPKGIADLVHENADHFYVSIPFDLDFPDINKEKFLEAGKRVVKEFGISKRFFHIEFFVLNSNREGFANAGEFAALECNMRAPGGNTPDLIDFANSVSVYQIYADVICFDENRQNMNLDKFYAFASHRRKEFTYTHSKEKILEKYKNNLCMSGNYPDHIAEVMGNEYYYAKFKSYFDGLDFDNFVRLKSFDNRY